MSTVLGFEVYPLRDELQKIGSMSSFGISATAQRRPSGSAVSTTSYGSSTNHQFTSSAVLSALEDSGNVNNRGILHHSSSHHRYGIALASDRNDSSTVEKPGNGANGLQRVTSAGSLQRQTSSVSESASRNDSYDADAGTERIVEEKRKTAVGDGFSIHRYTLGRLLGKGGFAKVYLCTAMDTGKNYAVKVVPKANLVKARARQKLQTEIKIHRNLKHRYVCQYKHYFEDRTNCYILLELCHNQSLNEMIKRRKRLTEPEAAYFIKQLVEATRYMHDQNVIHRDLKLGNLFLDKDMLIKVGDLGLATKVEDKDEKRKTICGTPNYIAPEIIQGDKALRGHSFEVDIWSMGVILFTVLIGKPPYEAKDVKATYQRILNNEYSFPRHIDVSPAAKSLIKSLLQSKPSDRPTLDEIDAHPFLADNHIPMFLPTSTLTFSPNWRVNEYGELVCSEKASSESNYSSSKKPSLPRASSSSGRQPFSSRDPNMHKTISKAIPRPEKDVINMERVVRTAVAAMTGGGIKINRDTSAKPTASPPFAIFDESARKVSPGPEPVAQQKAPPEAMSVAQKPAPRHVSQPLQAEVAVLTEEALCRQTRLLSLTSGPKPVESSAPSSLFTQATESVFSNTENDADVLQHMVDHIATVISIAESRKGTYRASSLRVLASPQGPLKWVARYVDYTSKYGLGFLLNDGCSGVYFNDSTKITLEPVGETFQYIERKRVHADEGTPNRLRGETTVDTHKLDTYPESLQKKVTLLKHFRNHLVHHQGEGGDDGRADIATRSYKSGGLNASDLVYVKKWVRAKHAILFSLSNRTVQVIFDDQTEILLTPDVAFLTYVDTHHKRCAYNFTDELVGSSAEIQKRLKYTKEIMMQLLSGQRS